MLKMSSIEDKYIGSRLKLRRSQLGVSQTQLAKFEKLTFQQVQKYESGVNKIASGRLYKFGRILHVPINYFFDGLEEHTEALEGNSTTKASILSKEIDKDTHADLRRLNLYFLKITDPVIRKSVVILAKSLVSTEIKKYVKKTKEYILSNSKKLGVSDE